METRDQKAMVSIHLISAWKEASELGLSENFCDRITMERDPPQRLLGVVFALVTQGAQKKILTHRERQCLSLLSFGFPQREIARYLAMSPHTVKFHIKKCRMKLGVHTAAQAVAVAYRAKEIL